MTLIVCLDDHNGMMFNGRRQSSDRVVDSCIRDAADEGRLIVSAYSVKRFPDASVAQRNDLKNLSSADVCFAETADFLNCCLPYARRIVVYRWNRAYPADTYFPDDLLGITWELKDTVDLLGYSHETITQEEYIHA